MRAFVEPLSYRDDGLATAWVARIYAGDDPAKCWSERQSPAGVCVLRREAVDEVLAGPLHGVIDRQADKDMRRAMRLSGLRRYGYYRTRLNAPVIRAIQGDK